MKAVGEQLQGARQERKLSLADVAHHTKVQPWVLEALEADRLQELMSPIYVKGFLTTYAKFLDLDPASLIPHLRWPQPEPVQQPVPPAHEPAWSVAWRALQPRLRRLGPAAALSAALIGLLAVNPGRWLGRLSPSTVNPPKLASVTTGTESAPKPPELPTMTVLATQPLELQVSAHRTTWIEVRADGKLLTQQRLPRGANERWAAKRQFELIVAKPSQVELVLNGQPISPLAIAHQGRLLITHHGVTKLPDETR
jgi:cytoskeletal protein RodZ